MTFILLAHSPSPFTQASWWKSVSSLHFPTPQTLLGICCLPAMAWDTLELDTVESLDYEFYLFIYLICKTEIMCYCEDWIPFIQPSVHSCIDECMHASIYPSTYPSIHPCINPSIQEQFLVVNRNLITIAPDPFQQSRYPLKGLHFYPLNPPFEH
jgi:hypothetical protein